MNNDASTEAIQVSVITLDEQSLPPPAADARFTLPDGPLQEAGSPDRQLDRFWQDFHLLRDERAEAIKRLQHAQREILHRLAKAASYKDDDTGSHIRRIGALSAALARHYGQPEAWCDLIEEAAPMHDVGKIGIPDSILKKTGPLDEHEWVIMRMHPTIGAEILGGSDVPVLQLAAEIALTHHERWDGTGYPRGLAGEHIPLSGQIVAIVDFFDALTMDRCYRAALDYQQALKLLVEQRGGQFNPKLVDTVVAQREHLIELRERLIQAQ